MRIPRHSPVIVVALDSSLILREHQIGTFDELLINLASAARSVAKLVSQGCRVVVAYPETACGYTDRAAGSLLGETVNLMPTDARSAGWQGLIGYMLTQCLKNHLRQLRVRTHVCALVTQFEICLADSTRSQRPDSRADVPDAVRTTRHAARGTAESTEREPDSSAADWRLVSLVEKPIVRNLVAGGSVVVCGTPGVPVQKDAEGYLKGLRVSIDGDLAAAQLALDIKADALLMLTDAIHTCPACESVGKRGLGVITVADMERYIALGRVNGGSMDSKVEAALRLARAGKAGAIASSADALHALQGKAGMLVVDETQRLAGRAIAWPATPSNQIHKLALA